MPGKNIIPLVSVVMSIYNEPEKWARQAIESILSQTFSDFELIIINDNPGRAFNIELLKEYKNRDSRIVFINNDQNLGLTKSLNKGLKRAQGKYIARMDADDVAFSNRFKIQVDFLNRRKEIVAVGTFVQLFGKKNGFGIRYKRDMKVARNSLLLGTPISHPSAMIRNEVIRKYNIMYDESIKFAQDYKFWYELSKVGGITNIPKILLKYRKTNKQISSSNKEEQDWFASEVRGQVVKNFFPELYNAGFKENTQDYGRNELEILIHFLKKELNNSEINSVKSYSYLQRLAYLSYTIGISPGVVHTICFKELIFLSKAILLTNEFVLEVKLLKTWFFSKIK